MKYYYHEHLAGYRRMQREGKRSWGEIHGKPDDLMHFSSRSFLEQVLPRLRFETVPPRALELGCGTGPGACFLAERGFRVDGIDLIPLAIETAREIAQERGLDIRYAVMDVTQLPHTGPKYDLIVDSFCLQGIVLDADRRDVFAAVRARLRPAGFYLISSAMYAAARHHPEQRIVDPRSGVVFDRYDDVDLFDPVSEILYAHFTGTRCGEVDDHPEAYAEAIEVDGRWYLPRRRYRTPQGLREELGAAGFSVLLQSGDYGENVVCALEGAPVSLSDQERV